MLASDSRVDRSASVSSMRRMNVPSLPRASSQLKSAVRALPTCSCPVGLGANRTRMALGLARRSSATACAAIASPRPTASTPSLVLPLTLTRSAAMPSAAASPRANLVDERRNLRPLEDHGDVDVADLETARRARAARASRSRSMLDASFHRGSVSGKCRPMSPSARGAEDRRRSPRGRRRRHRNARARPSRTGS